MLGKRLGDRLGSCGARQKLARGCGRIGVVAFRATVSAQVARCSAEEVAGRRASAAADGNETGKSFCYLQLWRTRLDLRHDGRL